MTVLAGFTQDVAADVERLLQSGEFATALDVLRQHQPVDDSGRVDHLSLAGRAATFLGRYHEARDHLVRALWIGRRLSRSRVRLRGYLCSLLLNAGDLARAQRELRRALTEIRLTRRDLDHEPRLLSYLGGVYRRQGMIGMSIRVHEEAVALARKRGLTQWGAYAVNLASALFVHGEIDRAEHLLEDLLTQPEAFNPSQFPYVRVLLAGIALEHRDCARADRILAPMADQADRMEQSCRSFYGLCQVESLLIRGRPKDAMILLEAMVARAENEPGEAFTATGIVARVAEALHDLGRYDEALKQAQRAVLLGRASDPFDWAHAMQVAARCQARLGRMEAARTTIAEAYTVLRTSDYMLERRNLKRTAESLGIDMEVLDGEAEPDPESNGATEANRHTEPQWLTLRNRRSFLTVDPVLLLGIRRSSADDIPVLIEGESGTGKELVAHLIHELGPRSSGPFVVVDCTTLAPDLAEAELFGAARGAYTGAVTDRQGLVAAAQGGTLFLDEVTELALHLQAKLLRLLQEGTYRRLGEPRERKADFRIVAAANREVEQSVRDGRLRLDLFYRLKGYRLRLSPLRARPRERRLLADQFARGAGLLGVSSEGHRLLGAYSWPGNVRELEMLIRVATSGIPTGGWLGPSEIESAAPDLNRQPRDLTLRTLKGETERDGLTRALDQSGGNVAAAARSLGLSRQGMYKAMQRAGIKRTTAHRPT